MTDKEIEEKIVEASFSHPIKTSAYDILSAYEKKRGERIRQRPWYARKGFLAGAVSFGVLAVALGTTLGIALGRGPSERIPGGLAPENNAVLNQASYEIIAGIGVAHGESSSASTLSLKRAFQDRADEESSASLVSAVAAFERYRPMVFALEEASVNQSYYVPVESDDPDYPYAIQVEENILYYGEAFEEIEEEEISPTVQAKLKEPGGTTYPVQIEKEVEPEEGEVETKLSTTIALSSDEELKVSRKEKEEVEVGETESSYTVVRTKGGEEVSEISFDLESEGGATEKTFSIEEKASNPSKYEYSIKEIVLAPPSLTLSYQSEEVRFQDDSYYVGETKIYP